MQMAAEHIHFNFCSKRRLLFIIILTIHLFIFTHTYLHWGSSTVIQTISRYILQQTRLKSNDSPPLCTLDFLRRHLLENGTFFSDGSWDFKDRKWRPGGCSLSAHFRPSKIGRCLKEKNINKIGQTGDSNSIKYMDALKRGEGAFACKEQKREDVFLKTATIEYFSPPLVRSSMIVSTRDCQGCASQLEKCLPRGGSVTAIEIENLISLFTKDHDVTTKRNVDNDECDDRLRTINGIFCQVSVTTQEVYFREYWPLTGLPDLVIIYAMHTHESQKRTPRDFERDFTWFIDLVCSAVPKTTKILYWNAPQVCREKQPPMWRNVTSNTYINQLNAICASVIKRFITEKKVTNLYPFYDLYEISNDVMEWNKDGVHFYEKWYKSIMSLFWETLCSE